VAKQSYDVSLARLLQHEGGYTNHPADPGGPTNFGITIYDYRKYVKPGATAADVRRMTVEEAKSIYRAKYWDAQRCDELPAGVDYAVFDYGVNSGIGRSKKVLQRVVGVTADGVLGPQTMRAVGRSDPKTVIVAICDERLRFLKRLRSWPVFGRGWGRRAAQVKATALAMAANAPPAQEPPVAAAPGRAHVPPPKTAQRASAGAVAAAGAVAVHQAHQAHAGMVTFTVIIIVAIAAAAGAWLFWHWHAQHQQERPA
jgi:lysozyme family protein